MSQIKTKMEKCKKETERKGTKNELVEQDPLCSSIAAATTTTISATFHRHLTK